MSLFYTNYNIDFNNCLKGMTKWYIKSLIAIKNRNIPNIYS